MKILYCVSEVAPIIKVGGLGDVAGSLPKALARLGVDIEIIVPKYQEIDEKIVEPNKIELLGRLEVPYATFKEKVKLWKTILPKSTVPVFLLENEKYLSKDGHRAFAGTVSEIERFTFFAKAIAEFVRYQTCLAGRRVSDIRYQIDLLHLNDWHTSLVPLLLPDTCHLPSLLTIHNISYQGVAPLDLLEKLGLTSTSCEVLRWDAQNRDIDILMEGIIHATLVNTVSPTYAKEIMTKEQGFGIEEVLKGREARVSGILNGIDYEVWNPQTDPHINFKFQSASWRTNFKMGKAKNKQNLQKELKLAIDPRIPLLAFIGRLEPRQKGLDILYQALEKLLGEGSFQFIILGVGDKFWEENYQSLSSRYPENCKFINRFDEAMAHQIYAGVDSILVPSRFEPCGLPQMIAMRYGSLPLVRKTGGLADTVKDKETGFVFVDYSAVHLANKIKEVLGIYRQPDKWWAMTQRAMNQDFSWEASAKKYLELYKKAIILHNK